MWGDLQQVFVDADAAGRLRVLELVRPAAIFQPGRIIALVERALGQPATPSQVAGPFVFEVSDDDAGACCQTSSAPRDCIRSAPGVRSPCCGRWAATKRGAALESQPPDRVAQEVGGYDHTLLHSEALVDLVERLVESPGELDAHHWSPLSLLEPSLKREGTRLRAAGFAFQVGSYQVLAEPIADVRAQVLDILESQARGGSPRNRRLAAGLLGEANTQPRGIDGLRPSGDQFDQRLPQQLDLLQRLEPLLHEADPLVRMQLRREVGWHARHGSWPDARELAQALVSAPADLDERLLGAIAYPWDHTVDFEDMQAHVRGVAGELAELPQDDGALAERLDEAMISLMATGQANVEPHSLWRFSPTARLPARLAWWAGCSPTRAPARRRPSHVADRPAKREP